MCSRNEACTVKSHRPQIQFHVSQNRGLQDGRRPFSLQKRPNPKTCSKSPTPPKKRPFSLQIPDKALLPTPNTSFKAPRAPSATRRTQRELPRYGGARLRKRDAIGAPGNRRKRLVETPYLTSGVRNATKKRETGLASPLTWACQKSGCPPQKKITWMEAMPNKPVGALCYGDQRSSP